MKVAYDYQIFSIRQYGGVSRYFVELAAELSKCADTQIQILAPLIRSRCLSESMSRISTLGIDLSSIPVLPNRLVRPINAMLFRAMAAITTPDIVHETHYTRSRTAPRSAKIVTTIHDAIPERLPDHFSFSEQQKGLIRTVLKRADHIICVSQSTRRDLMDIYDVSPERVSVTLLGSSLASPVDGPADIGMPYFLHVGIRHSYKNFNRIIQAFGEAHLYRTHKLISFTGASFSTAEIAAMETAGVPLSSVMQVSGDDQKLSRYYAGADALIFPSLYEGFGIPLLEAMRCGCPIITANTSSMPEVAGDAAIYCDPYDIRTISDALIQVTSSADERAKMVARGLERAQGFTWTRCAEETHKIYRDLLQ